MIGPRGLAAATSGDATWWLSFVDAGRSLGVAIVRATDEISAIKAAHALGINPGGEVAYMRIDTEQLSRLSFELPHSRLIPPEEARALADRIASELAS